MQIAMSENSRKRHVLDTQCQNPLGGANVCERHRAGTEKQEEETLHGRKPSTFA